MKIFYHLIPIVVFVILHHSADNIEAKPNNYHLRYNKFDDYNKGNNNEGGSVLGDGGGPGNGGKDKEAFLFAISDDGLFKVDANSGKIIWNTKEDIKTMCFELDPINGTTYVGKLDGCMAKIDANGAVTQFVILEDEIIGILAALRTSDIAMNLWVQHGTRISKINTDNEKLLFTTPEEHDYSHTVAMAIAETSTWVAQYPWTAADGEGGGIYKIDADTGDLVGYKGINLFTKENISPMQLVALDNGDIAFIDIIDKKVRALDEDGDEMWETFLNAVPTSITVDKNDGSIWVIAKDFNTVYHMKETGKIIDEFNATCEDCYPTSIVVAEKYIYIGTNTGKVLKFAKPSTYISLIELSTSPIPMISFWDGRATGEA